MDISTPILAAIVGSIVAGVISFCVNIISLAGQYILNEKHHKRTIRFQWRRETISLIKELRREALRMELSQGGIKPLEGIINEIETQHSDIPQEYVGSDVSNRIDSIALVHQEYLRSPTEVSIPEYRRDIIQNAEKALDSFEKLSKNKGSLY